MKINKKVVILSGLIIVSSIYSFIFFKNTQSIYTTGDLSFHLSRIKGLSTIFTSPINYETFNYTGYGVNYFYPFLTFFSSCNVILDDKKFDCKLYYFTFGY